MRPWRNLVGARISNTWEIDGIVVEPHDGLTHDNVLVTHSHYDHGKMRLPEKIASWQVIETPGHCPDHVCLYDGETLIAGDMVEGETGRFPLVLKANKDTMITSLEGLILLPIKRIFPGHGVVLEGDRCREALAQFLEHVRKLV